MTENVIPISEIEFDPQNARRRTERSSYLIRESLQQYGPLRSLVGQRLPDGRIIVRAGNGTLEEAGQIGIDKVRVIERRPDELVVVVADDLDEKQWKQYAVVDNRSSDLSSWDFKVLEELAEEVDLSICFQDGELNKLMESLQEVVEEEEPEEGLTDPDDIPDEDDVETRVKRGEVWQLGQHRIMCGDSTCKADVERLMDGTIAVLLHADPPYGMGKEKDGVENDNLYREKLDAFQMEWWKTFRPYLEDNGSAYIWGNAEDLWRLWYCGGLKDFERLTFRSQIVWDKPPSAGPCGSPIGSEKMRSYPHGYEACLFFMLGEQGFNNNADNYWDGWEPIRAYLWEECKKVGLDNCKAYNTALGLKTSGGGMFAHHVSPTGSQWCFLTQENYAKLQAAANGKAFKREYDELKREFYSTRSYFDNTHDNMTDVWNYKRVTGDDRHGHATPKPVEMIERIIKSSSPADGLVIEPFLGSGSTLIACEKTGRTCYGMEISEKYCDVIIQRWEDFTGGTAVLVS